MKKTKGTGLILPCIIFLSVYMLSCSNDSVKEISPVHIRIKNSSGLDFDSAIVWDTEFGFVKAGEYSMYSMFETAYDKASVSVTVDGNIYSLTVIDYVGEEPLRRGYYTLYLNILEPDSGGYLVQDMRRD